MEDPFAAAPEEAQQPEPTAQAQPPTMSAKESGKQPGGATAYVDVKPRFESAEGKVVVTFKGGTGFDAPWIVIHATDVQDAYNQVTGEGAVLLAKLMERTQVAAKHFASQSQAKPAAAAASGGNTSNAPQGAQQAPGGEKRYCEHGEMEFKSGVAKASGKPYSLFGCTERDRDQQCKAQFLK